MDTLSFKTLLEIILKVTQKRANILADRYLLKDGSIISKWKTNKVVPKSYDIERIVEFAAEETSPSQKRILRDKIEELVTNSTIQPEIKKLILEKEDFREFLHDTLSISVCNADTTNVEKRYEPKPLGTTNKAEDSINGTVYKKDNRFKGTLEFDIGLPEKGTSNLSNIEDVTNLELKGTVNMSPKSRYFNTTKYLGKTSVLSIIGVWLLAGLLILALNKPSTDNHAIYSSKTVENQEEIQSTGTNNIGSQKLDIPSTSVTPDATPVLTTPTEVSTPTHVSTPTDVPTTTQVPEPKQASSSDSSQSTSGKVVQNRNSSTTNITKKDNSNNTNSNTNSNNSNSNNTDFSGNITITGKDINFTQGVDINISNEEN